MPVLANPYPDMKGSPYVGDFELGKIIFSERDTAENLMVNFNAFTNKLEYRIEGELLALDANKIFGFVLNEKSNPSVYRSGYAIPSVGPNRFVEILVDGEYTLINHKFKVIMDDSGASYGSQRAKVFEGREQLYVVKDGEVKLWKAKKKNLASIFGPDYEKVLSLEKDWSLDLSNLSDVTRLIKGLNL
ncbi:hypothetical protein P872_07980 [Rhodonellum psychrophilum GCM71 = DSM 17998]|uniref:Uncharacterized protein n=2 Tax=Rhodonellum TaxID=336827 RepID=U5BWJ8_9BACT|nr:hypothetical protein P872_07980 [Rhodonellum psychrophilum GCM71 = DSM 17998]